MSMHRKAGFSLVELMVAIAVLGILLTIALPSMGSFFANSRVKAKAESALNGVQLARMEAIKRNARVEFRFSVNTSWSVCLVSDNCATVLHSVESGESGSGLTVLVTPSSASKVTFSGVGATTANSDASAMINTIEFDHPDVADSNVWQIRVTTGGMARLCNPALSAGDPNAC